MVPLSEISSSKAYKNLLKTQIKFSELTSVSELLPMARVGSSETTFPLLLAAGSGWSVKEHEGHFS